MPWSIVYRNDHTLDFEASGPVHSAAATEGKEPVTMGGGVVARSLSLMRDDPHWVNPATCTTCSIISI